RRRSAPAGADPARVTLPLPMACRSWHKAAAMTAPESRSESTRPRPALIPFYPGIAPIAARYDGFVLDLWGVIHDGITPYPGVADTLLHLKRLQKRVILLSNAPRRAAEIVTAMARKMGIG